jgi:hypothetical protein
MARYLASITKHLRDVSDLLTARYGNNSSVSASAVRALGSATLLENEFLSLDAEVEGSDTRFEADYSEHETAASPY